MASTSTQTASSCIKHSEFLKNRRCGKAGEGGGGIASLQGFHLYLYATASVAEVQVGQMAMWFYCC